MDMRRFQWEQNLKSKERIYQIAAAVAAAIGNEIKIGNIRDTREDKILENWQEEQDF